jgi:hypothetical protein
MVTKLNIPPAMQRRLVRRLDQIANDPASPTHSATTAARTLLARAKQEDVGDDRPTTRPPLVLLPDNDRDRAISDASRARVLAGEFPTVVLLYNDREPDHVRKNDELIAAARATLDAAYPEVDRDPDDPEAAQLADAERRRKARDKKRRQRADKATAAIRLLPAPTVEAQ